VTFLGNDLRETISIIIEGCITSLTYACSTEKHTTKSRGGSDGRKVGIKVRKVNMDDTVGVALDVC